ncbi:hypothetical protein PR202_ga11039 [Eleusine coracana subsp. coracana]|uniref:Uncharacterized protein n=1 Tax=Eleusine coracana subsp. coracana TaxID=191504 RepID=A0AAV5C8B5_ELECO|nr:hypothetical protein PR202_ga11039 [Eleusine coracana subsp. coracana]
MDGAASTPALGEQLPSGCALDLEPRRTAAAVTTTMVVLVNPCFLSLSRARSPRDMTIFTKNRQYVLKALRNNVLWFIVAVLLHSNISILWSRYLLNHEYFHLWRCRCDDLCIDEWGDSDLMLYNTTSILPSKSTIAALMAESVIIGIASWNDLAPSAAFLSKRGSTEAQLVCSIWKRILDSRIACTIGHEGGQFEATLNGQDEVPPDVMPKLSSVGYFLLSFSAMIVSHQGQNTVQGIVTGDFEGSLEYTDDRNLGIVGMVSCHHQCKGQLLLVEHIMLSKAFITVASSPRYIGYVLNCIQICWEEPLTYDLSGVRAENMLSDTYEVNLLKNAKTWLHGIRVTGYLLHYNCFGKLSMYLFGCLADYQAARKALPFCYALIDVAVTADLEWLRLFLVNEMLPTIILLLDDFPCLVDEGEITDTLPACFKDWLAKELTGLHTRASCGMPEKFPKNFEWKWELTDCSLTILERLEENCEPHFDLLLCNPAWAVDIFLDSILFFWEPQFHPLIREGHTELLKTIAEQLAFAEGCSRIEPLEPHPDDFVDHLWPYAYSYIKRKKEESGDDFVHKIVADLKNNSFETLDPDLIRMSFEVKKELESLISLLDAEGFFKVDDDSTDWNNKLFSDSLERFNKVVFSGKFTDKCLVIRGIMDYKRVLQLGALDWPDAVRAVVRYNMWKEHLQQFWVETRHYEHKYYNILAQPLQKVFSLGGA